LSDLLLAITVTFGTVFVAELGDKSQLLTLALTSRYHPRAVLTGVAIACVVLAGLAVAVGSVLGAVIPRRLLDLAAGIAFLVFGVLNLRKPEDEDELTPMKSGHGAVVTVTSTFMLAELGDKTQLATLALAGTYQPIGVWIGSATGEFAANALAVLIGVALHKRLPAHAIRKGAAVLFFVFGAVLLVAAIRG
jgi:Ca2+/H+ antiporter, TMEM165/GDT1 family